MYKSSTCNNWCVVCIGPTNINSMVQMGDFAFGHSKHPVCVYVCVCVLCVYVCVLCVCVVCTCACVICDGVE